MEQALRRALDRIEELEARLARVEASPSSSSEGDGAARGTAGLTRRHVLGALGAGAAGAAFAFAPRPAAAAAGEPVLQGQENDAGDATTTLRANTTEPVLVVVGEQGTAIYGSSNTGVAVAGSGNAGTGVRGYSSGSPGVEGLSDGNWGLFAHGGLGGAHAENGFTRAVGELAQYEVGAYGKAKVGVEAIGRHDPDAPFPSEGPTVGLKATGDTAVDAAGPTALRTKGRLEFSRSGVVWVPAGAGHVDVTAPDTATAPLNALTTRVLATAMGPGAVVGFTSVRSTKVFRITLTRPASAFTRVAWFVIG